MPDPGGSAVPQHFSGANYDVVAIAASAGGLHAYSIVLAGLPKSFPAAIVGVQHLDPHHRSLMSEILARRTALHVKEAEEGEALKPGVAYLAPPDWHLLVSPDGTVSLSHAALVHFVRPSADLLFKSVSTSYGPRAIAVVLSGTGNDGAQGARAIQAMGGKVIVQDRATAEFSGMPEAAGLATRPDFVVRLEEVPAILVALVSGPVEDDSTARQIE